MRWMVLGAQGMLGRDLVATLAAAGHTVETPDLDITDAAAVAELPPADVMVNCAAWTAVDDAETQEGSAFLVNAVGPHLLARAARRHGARLVQISTDYVFPGDSAAPYEADAALGPRSAYGRTKAAGEWAVRAEAPDHLIVRTAWLYGAHGPCFPRTIARIARERGTVSVVGDQIGQPTWTRDLAGLVLRLVGSGAPTGTYHGTAAGATSWYGFAREIVRSAGLDPDVVTEVTSAAMARPAPRPANSVLSHRGLEEAGIAPIGHWRDRWALAAPEVLGRDAAPPPARS